MYYIALVADVMLREYKDPRLNIGSLLMKTLDLNVETLCGDYFHYIKPEKQ